MVKCRSFFHHVGANIRVECTRHIEFVEDVEPTPKGEQPTARQIAQAKAREHEESHS